LGFSNQRLLAPHRVHDSGVDGNLLPGEIIHEPPGLAIRKGIGKTAGPMRRPKVARLSQGVQMGVAAEHVHGVGQRRLFREHTHRSLVFRGHDT